MNIRDLNPMHDRIGLEGLVAYGVDPMLHFAELLRVDTFRRGLAPAATSSGQSSARFDFHQAAGLSTATLDTTSTPSQSAVHFMFDVRVCIV